MHLSHNMAFLCIIIQNTIFYILSDTGNKKTTSWTWCIRKTHKDIIRNSHERIDFLALGNKCNKLTYFRINSKDKLESSVDTCIDCKYISNPYQKGEKRPSVAILNFWLGPNLVGLMVINIFFILESFNALMQIAFKVLLLKTFWNVEISVDI